MLPSASLGRHITLAPGLAVAIYGGKPFAQTAPLARPDLDALSQDAAPGDLIVMAHTDPDPTDLSPLRELLRAGFRTWLGVPSNQLAALALARGVEAAAERAARWARWAVEQGCECLMFNGERGRDRSKDWVADPNVPGDVELVRALSRAVPEAARKAAPRLALAFTSHDMPQWFALAWDVLLGEDSEVDLHAPQHYPADGSNDHPETFLDADRRVRASQARWLALVTKGKVAPVYAPSGSGYVPYGQLWGLTPAGVARTLDASDGACAWALPRLPVGRADDAGLLGLRALLRARRAEGRRAGAIGRVQLAHGLPLDHAAGTATRAVLGLR